MEIINIIVVGETTISSLGVVSVYYYVIEDAQLYGEVVGEAEEKFKSILEELGVDEDTIEQSIMDRFYEKDGTTISIAWSYPENLQS
jgi:ferritin-like protein